MKSNELGVKTSPRLTFHSMRSSLRRVAMKNAPCRLEDCKTYALKGIDTWKVQGHSGAGERTGYFVHGPQLVVDCGLSTWKTPSAVLLTHRHTDHSAELPQIISSHTPPRKGQEGL